MLNSDSESNFGYESIEHRTVNQQEQVIPIQMSLREKQ
jgi:hypothetical protein